MKAASMFLQELKMPDPWNPSKKSNDGSTNMSSVKAKTKNYVNIPVWAVIKIWFNVPHKINTGVQVLKGC